MTTIRANFCDDWVAYLSAQLSALGFPPQSGESALDISKRFFNLRLRLIQPGKRAVLLAPSLQVPNHLRDGFDLVKKKFESGDLLTPHLSTSIGRDADYDDDLLNHWGIYHCHLGTAVRPNGFMERTGELLMVYVTPDTAHFICIGQHGDWTKQRMIQKLHDTWPNAISRFKVNGRVDPITDEEVGELRKAHMNSCTTVSDGTVYAPLGGGTTSAGGSTHATLMAIQYAKKVKSLEAFIKANAGQILDSIAQDGVAAGDELALTLLVEDGCFYAVSDSPPVRCKLGPVSQ